MTTVHAPVLFQSVIENLDPRPDQNFIDGTIGGAGHAAAILERTAPKGKLLGIDRDEDALKRAARILQEQKFRKRAILVHDSFSRIETIVQREKFDPVHGILMDLGLSSDQLEQSGRGFSFRKKEPLDMRFDTHNQMTAAKLIEFQSAHELERIFREYGEERFAGPIARRIVEERQRKEIRTTDQLVEIIASAVPARWKRQRLHFATRVFQALRIAVNDELSQLQEGLSQAETILAPNGKIAVITFHSLEDRIVKNFFKTSPLLTPITKKPIIPSEHEIAKNPRSRSAKLRIATKQP